MEQLGPTATAGQRHDTGRFVPVQLAIDADIARRSRLTAINRSPAGPILRDDGALGKLLEHAHRVHGQEPM